jgi:hypothetical protein
MSWRFRLLYRRVGGVLSETDFDRQLVNAYVFDAPAIKSAIEVPNMRDQQDT